MKSVLIDAFRVDLSHQSPIWHSAGPSNRTLLQSAPFYCWQWVQYAESEGLSITVTIAIRTDSPVDSCVTRPEPKLSENGGWLRRKLIKSPLADAELATDTPR